VAIADVPVQGGGYDLGRLLDSKPLSRTANPHAVHVLLARIAVFMADSLDLDSPPGLTVALRPHQRYHARIFLASLATHRSWL
jgi:hypothetical protein